MQIKQLNHRNLILDWNSACAPQGYSKLLSAKAFAKLHAGLKGLLVLKFVIKLQNLKPIKCDEL